MLVRKQIGAIWLLDQCCPHYYLYILDQMLTNSCAWEICAWRRQITNYVDRLRTDLLKSNGAQSHLSKWWFLAKHCITLVKYVVKSFLLGFCVAVVVVVVVVTFCVPPLLMLWCIATPAMQAMTSNARRAIAKPWQTAFQQGAIALSGFWSVSLQRLKQRLKSSYQGDHCCALLRKYWVSHGAAICTETCLNKWTKLRI